MGRGVTHRGHNRPQIDLNQNIEAGLSAGLNWRSLCASDIVSCVFAWVGLILGVLLSVLLVMGATWWPHVFMDNSCFPCSRNRVRWVDRRPDREDPKENVIPELNGLDMRGF